MAALYFIHHHTILLKPSLATPKSKLKPICTSPIRSSLTTPQFGFSDPLVLQLAETLEDSLPSLSSSSSSQFSPLQKIRDASSETLLSTPWPSLKDEPFRFTDTSFIKNCDIYPTSKPLQSVETLQAVPLDVALPSLTIVDGHIVDSLSNLQSFPDRVYVGSLFNVMNSGNDGDSISKKVSEFFGEFDWGDLFWSINGLGNPDLAVIYVPAGCRVEEPIHLKYYSAEGSDEQSGKLPLSNPRVFVLVEKGGEVGVVEEFCGDGSKCYWTNPVLEVVIGEGARFRHSYVQNQSSLAAHTKWTSVRQESANTYHLVEISTGGRLSRHNLHIQQLGPDTETELSSLHLSLGKQNRDLHSRLVLDHPRGYSRQLHKCIVAHSEGQAVFDGNVQVNRQAASIL
ncbi:hypothetical protein SAY86_022191 [Trapa natans]|uniref:SUF system FeS cluster assembly SufBD core domain-containing protein n=1 Tax=Trapa natans TaxID=22666 RepID=A0AAN7MB02_TRANT|nr:hypothetical protein SAY86_022191 [Trapa natans]